MGRMSVVPVTEIRSAVPDRNFAGPATVGQTIPADIVHAHNWIINSWIPVKSFVKAPLVWTLHAFGLNCARIAWCTPATRAVDQVPRSVSAVRKRTTERP